MNTTEMVTCACGGTPHETLPADEIETHVKRLKALSNSVRLKIVDLIYHGGGELCVCDLTESFDLTQPTLSHHLKVLREAGLIQSRRDGTFVYHRLRSEAFASLEALSGRFRTPKASSSKSTLA
jgi:ArsR family transcriptional regulator, arsenate/arsenite/antimonite-responsive transcriptional repressor